MRTGLLQYHRAAAYVRSLRLHLNAAPASAADERLTLLSQLDAHDTALAGGDAEGRLAEHLALVSLASDQFYDAMARTGAPAGQPEQRLAPLYPSKPGGARCAVGTSWCSGGGGALIVTVPLALVVLPSASALVRMTG